jgi:hypothetical protein
MRPGLPLFSTGQATILVPPIDISVHSLLVSPVLGALRNDPDGLPVNPLVHPARRRGLAAFHVLVAVVELFSRAAPLFDVSSSFLYQWAIEFALVLLGGTGQVGCCSKLAHGPK